MPASVRDQLTVCSSLPDLERYIAKVRFRSHYHALRPTQSQQEILIICCVGPYLLRALRFLIHVQEAIPKEYGGDSPFALGEAEEENGLKRLVEQTNARAAAAAAASAGGGGSSSS